MKISQEEFRNQQWHCTKDTVGMNPQLVLCFGDRLLIAQESTYGYLKRKYPESNIVMVSTAGEFSNSQMADKSIVATALEFEKTKIACAMINIKNYDNCFTAGTMLAAKLPQHDLRFVLVFSDGVLVNGSDLVTAMNEAFEQKIPIAGGLAGDGNHFKETWVGLNDHIGSGNLVAIGFYGNTLQLGFGSKGGWSHFGPSRVVTRSEKNVLHELDDRNALDLYKKYLGDYADKLPSSALLFPLALQTDNNEEVVRTILSIDQEKKTMTFAGNVPEGARVRFMKTTLNHLVTAASQAAEASFSNQRNSNQKLSLLVSCVGRKIIFGNRLDEEFETVRKTFDDDTVITGFYAYGEISPYSNFTRCHLHNQTMTITTISE